MKHGAVIVLGGAIQSIGINKRTNDPYFHPNLHWLSEHAEASAIRKASRTMGATIYIARVSNQGDLRMSRPCPRCMSALKDAGIKKIVYTINQKEYV